MWKYPPSEILVPIDFGEASRRAAGVAATLARRYGAKLLLLHAETFEAPVYFTREQLSVIEGQRMASDGVAERHLAGFVQLDVPFSAQVVQSPPAAAILDRADSIDLVVMGTDGRRGPSRWWLGSVAERVARHADVPVLVVRASVPESGFEKIFSRPVVVVGPRVLEAAASRYARGLAESFGGRVADQTASCEADIALEREASLVVVAKAPGPTPWFGESVEGMLRGCKLPMLFVGSSGS